MERVSIIDQPFRSASAYGPDMLIYCFSIHDAFGGHSELSGRMALHSDKSARAFGKAMIHDMKLHDSKRYASWIMEVTKGERTSFIIPFDSTKTAAI